MIDDAGVSAAAFPGDWKNAMRSAVYLYDRIGFDIDFA